jgi:hypothetical protein
MKYLFILSMLFNVCYGQKDSTKLKKDTSSKGEFTITTYGRNGNVIRQYTDTVYSYHDSTFFIKPKLNYD